MKTIFASFLILISTAIALPVEDLGVLDGVLKPSEKG